jgi:hypothetical protein
LLQELHDPADDVLREVLEYQLQVVAEEHLHHLETASQDLRIQFQVFEVLAAHRLEEGHGQFQKGVVSVVRTN